MQIEEGNNVDLYIPRKCSSTNRLITSKDVSSVQLNVGHVDENGVYTGQFTTFVLCGFVRAQMEDIDDPLFGNMGGPEELVLLREAYEEIRASCILGLMQTIMEIKAGLQGSETLKQGVGKALGEMESLDWLVPPMLQKAEMQRR